MGESQSAFDEESEACESSGGTSRSGRALIQQRPQAVRKTAVLQVGHQAKGLRAVAASDLSTKMRRAMMKYGHYKLKAANQRIQHAVKRMDAQWNTTITSFDTVVEHLIDGSANSEDECSDKLTEAKRQLHEMHEKVKFMAEHVNVSEERIEKIMNEITLVHNRSNGTETVCEDRIRKC